jgi:hypothetical protein
MHYKYSAQIQVNRGALSQIEVNFGPINSSS